MREIRPSGLMQGRELPGGLFAGRLLPTLPTFRCRRGVRQIKTFGKKT